MELLGSILLSDKICLELGLRMTKYEYFKTDIWPSHNYVHEDIFLVFRWHLGPS